MSSNVKEKYAGQIETFAIDWKAYLVNANNGAADTISTATWTIGGDDALLIQDASTEIGDIALIQTSAGTAGIQYTLQCKLTLTSGADTPIGFLRIDVREDPV